MNEGQIHIIARKYFRDNNWKLIAGEFPGGSDHELYPLCVTDPSVARDRSPRPRAHSTQEIIPDLIAIKSRCLAICEAKPRFSKSDENKLANLLAKRRDDLITALKYFADQKMIEEIRNPTDLTLYPVLIYEAEIPAVIADGFSHIVIQKSQINIIGSLERRF
jgi:hypothetical protein